MRPPHALRTAALLALLPQSLAQDERNPDIENSWLQDAQTALRGYKGS